MSDNNKQIVKNLTIEELRIYANEYRNRLRNKSKCQTNNKMSDNKDNIMSDKINKTNNDVSDKIMSDNKKVSPMDKMSDTMSDNSLTKQELDIFK